MTRRELDAELTALSKAEKAEVVERLAQEISNSWPGIEKTAGVAGGAACIVRTRIPVWIIENYRRLGWTEARIGHDVFAPRSSRCAARVLASCSKPRGT